MERMMKRITMVCLVLVAVFALVFAGSLMMRNTDPAAVAAQQGDRIWTQTPVLATAALGTDGAGRYTRGVAFPADTNAQPSIYYIDATGNTAGDPVDFYAYVSRVTSYVTLTAAYCGGTTTQAKVSDASMTQVTGGVSYVAIDNGAGTVGWAELKHGANLNNGAYGLIFHSGASNMGTPAANLPSLAGVTFPVGSKVYPLVKISAMPITTANSNTAKDNDQGLVAAPKGSPLLVLNQDATTGVTIHAVTVKYQ